MSFRQHVGVAQRLVALCLLFGAILPACAQDAPDTAATAAQPMSVVVTARKRDEPEISVPAAMTTFTAQSLEDFDIR